MCRSADFSNEVMLLPNSQTEMTPHANSILQRPARRKNRWAVILASVFLLGTGVATHSALPEPGKGGAGSDNSAGEGNFDHSGIYSAVSQAPGGEFGNSSAAAVPPVRGYYYFQNQGQVPFKLRSGQSPRAN